MRKSVIAAAIVLATALAAAPAAADPPPDFPHGDLDGGNWSAVAVEDNASALLCEAFVPCAIDATAAWTFEASPSGPPFFEQCSTSFAGEIGSDGRFEISDVEQLGGGSLFCTNEYQAPTDIPWAGEICRHEGSGEAWARLELKFASTPANGPTFGAVVEVGDGSEEIRFDQTDAGIGGTQYHGNWIHDLDLPIGDVLVHRSGEDGHQMTEPAACGWPELEV